MKIRACLLPVFAIVAMTSVLTFGQTAPPETPVEGLVEDIQGTVFWRRNARAKAVKLDPKRDLVRPLYADEQVRCAPGGLLRMRLGGQPKEIRGPSDWFIIPRRPISQADPNQAALDEYGRTGGRDRGEPSKVYSPAHRSYVRPGQFVIRWVPSPATRPVSLVILKGEGAELWRQNDIDGTTGYLSSDAARQSLAKYRDGEGEGPLQLKLIEQDEEMAEVIFSLLSLQKEQALEQELGRWDQEAESLMSHLGRAYVYTRYRMFAQTAEEYDAALKLAPESRDLLEKTIRAYRRIGNFARAKELSRRLPPGTTVIP